MKIRDEIKLLYKERSLANASFEERMKHKYGEKEIIFALLEILEEAKGKTRKKKKHGKN